MPSALANTMAKSSKPVGSQTSAALLGVGSWAPQWPQRRSLNSISCPSTNAQPGREPGDEIDQRAANTITTSSATGHTAKTTKMPEIATPLVDYVVQRHRNEITLAERLQRHSTY